MTDRPPRTLTELAVEVARRGNAAIRLAASGQPDARRTGQSDGWSTVHTLTQRTVAQTGVEDVDALGVLMDELQENRRRILALTRATIPPLVREGRVSALDEAVVLVQETHDRLYDDINRDAPATDPPAPAGVLPRTGRGSLAGELTGDLGTDDDLSDWSAYPKVPVAVVADFSELALFLGGDTNSFTGELLRLIAKADPENLNRLAAGFPRHVRAWVMWRACAPVPARTLVALLEATSMSERRRT